MLVQNCKYLTDVQILAFVLLSLACDTVIYHALSLIVSLVLPDQVTIIIICLLYTFF